MAKSRGKRFESEVYQLLKAHPQVAYFKHWPDIGLSNPVDFTGCLQGGKFLGLECKSSQAKSLSYAAFVSKKDRHNGDTYGRQWRTLGRLHNAGGGVYVFINFYGWPGRDGQRGRAWGVPFGWLVWFRRENARKSVPMAAIEESCTELVKVRGAWEWDGPQP